MTQKNEISKRHFLLGNAFFFANITSSILNNRLSGMQSDIIIGSVLGDGHLQVSSRSAQTARLRFTHSMKQKEYVDWQYNNLGYLCQNVQKPTKKTTKSGFEECVAYTSYSRELNFYHDIFYENISPDDKKPKFRKRIPLDVHLYLKNPVSLMVWYLDDGTLRTDSDACRLATHCFSEKENNLLKDCLYKNFNVKSDLEVWEKKKKSLATKQYSLIIPAKDQQGLLFINTFRDIVEKDIPSMSYKVNTKRKYKTP